MLSGHPKTPSEEQNKDCFFPRQANPQTIALKTSKGQIFLCIVLNAKIDASVSYVPWRNVCSEWIRGPPWILLIIAPQGRRSIKKNNFEFHSHGIVCMYGIEMGPVNLMCNFYQQPNT
jgi:hypothetical protein